jgi:hypothetical protein
MPAWYDRPGKRFRIREILEEFHRKAGRMPDIVHLWGWTWPETDDYDMRWGDYGDIDYADLGGLPAFRAALDDVQHNLGIPMSLYANAFLCTCSIPVGKRLGPACAMAQPDGKPLIAYRDTYCMCHAAQPWIEYMSQVYPRLYRETGVPILYVDQLATVSQVCWSKKHGHSVPLNVNEADYHFLKTIRQAAPGEVALYGEFPAPDQVSQFWDCHINYYFCDGAAERFSPRLDSPTCARPYSPPALNLYRFLFPKIVNLDLPLGTHHGSWHVLKSTFFNGEAIYDSFWDLDESRGHTFMVRAYDLKKQYADCFTSNAPEMLVDTLREGLYANKFPGKNRVLWTLYNGRYTTIRGPLLAVDHVAGATYRDAWRDRPLVPRIEGAKAIFDLDLDPQSIGCVVVNYKADAP